MCPMVSRKVIKSQEFFSIFLKALGGFGIFEFIGFNEGIREQFIQMKPFKRNFSICPYLYKTNNKDLELPLKDAKHWSPSMIDGDASI